MCSFQQLYVGLSPYNAPGVFSLLAATEITDGVWYPIGGFQKVRSPEGARLSEQQPLVLVLRLVRARDQASAPTQSVPATSSDAVDCPTRTDEGLERISWSGGVGSPPSEEGAGPCVRVDSCSLAAGSSGRACLSGCVFYDRLRDPFPGAGAGRAAGGCAGAGRGRAHGDGGGQDSVSRRRRPRRQVQVSTPEEEASPPPAVTL